ncbi:MAG: 1-acyl-sn-glycerol-3-phosphate acyltransferase [Coleofasciculus sp. G3-WIS-01]|uniref:lysophospholipid acyltransferase family protein n=1 Tax=Coleofasciculus sp. G3-WIS-01 TaxID=3069528 RepID=UPI0032F34A5C
MSPTESPDKTQEHSPPTKQDAITSHISPWLVRLVYPLGRHLVLPIYFGKIEVKGRENLPKDSPVIFAPTHRSRWDALTLAYAAGRDIIGQELQFMVSVDEMNGVQGWFIRRLGGFPVDPKRPGVSSLRHGIELLEQGKVLVIFPEGDIFRTEEIQPLEPGFARIALHAEKEQPGLGVKVVPIRIHYSQPVPHWGCDVDIHIGSPLAVADYCHKPVKGCAEEIGDDLRQALEDIGDW